MNAQLQESTAVAVIPPKPLTVMERALSVFSTVPDVEALRDLAKQSATITEITNEAGKDQCHASRMILKNTRLEIKRVGEEGREDAVQTSKAIIARQNALIAITQPEEDRLQAIQDAWDAKIEAEKEAKIQAEIARVASLQERVAELRGCQTLSPSSGSQLILEHIADLEAIPVDASFEEFEQQASDAKTAALVRLNGILGAAVAHEAEQAKIIAEREELAKFRAAEEQRQATARAEQAERELLAREAQAQADAAAKVERDRIAAEERARQVEEARAHAEQIRKDRERIAQEETAAKVIRDAEEKRIADERAENARIAAERQAELDAQAEAQRIANAVEAERLADQQAEIDRQQAALVEAQKPKDVPEVSGVSSTTDTLVVDPAPSPPIPDFVRGGVGTLKPRIVERPTAGQLIALVSSHYGVSPEMAAKWIQQAKIEIEDAT